jgi:hypothetical protein
VKKHQFQLQTPAIVGNIKLRKPQREAYAAIQKHFGEINPDREIVDALVKWAGRLVE